MGSIDRDWRSVLRELPVFEAVLAPFDPDAVPADPIELAAGWLSDAIASGA